MVKASKDWAISGIVHSVNSEAGTIELSVNCFNDLQTVPISSSMPGWLLRPNASFTTKIPRSCLDQGALDGSFEWESFQAQQYSYLDEIELLERLRTIHREGGAVS